MEAFTKNKAIAPVLDAENHEKWFRLVSSFLLSKDFDFLVKKTKMEFAWIYPIAHRPAGAMSTAKDESDAIAELGLHDTKASDFKGCWNIEKEKAYNKALGGTRYVLECSLSDIDLEIMEDRDFCEGWLALKAKYSRILPNKNNSNIIELNNFKLRDGMTVQDGWVKLGELRRKVVLQNPALKPAYGEDELLQIFLRGLPRAYEVTVEAIEAQSLDVFATLDKLRNREEKIASQTPDAEAALAAYGRNTRPRGGRGQSRAEQSTDWRKDRARSSAHSSPRPRSSSRPHRRDSLSGSDNDALPENLRCYLCDKRHFVSTCPALDVAREAADNFYAKYGKKKKKVAFNMPARKQYARFTQEGYLNDSDSEPESSDSSDAGSGGATEHCRISKELRGQCSPTHWANDSGASSHMSDNLPLFRHLRPIRRTKIEVGGGKFRVRGQGGV